jgi:serralysin
MGGGDALKFQNTTVASFTAHDFQLQIDYSKLGATTFSDDFSGPLSLYNKTYKPTGVWTPDFGYGGMNAYTLTGNGEKEIYTSPYYNNQPGTFSESPFVSNSDGTLSIWGKQSTNPNLYGYNYTSGLITTAHSFSQLYGYFEMRAELPTGAGTWPAFWMMPSNGSWPPELDIMEVLGNDPSAVHQTAHTQQAGVHTSSADIAYSPPTSDGFHTYGVLWSPTDLVFYVDGVETYDIATPADMNTKMYMLVNLALGGWAGGIDNSALPAEMKVDYVHAYALPSNWQSLF